ncbi:hypothetical protein F4815DRAFT_172121 [Daldinia loculata]|uniref:uncharacterized protein n=1 Tax=Daldinia loculata TaxID=103429 RepID=UPI0020C58CD1|nr:uncharacterized protein F4817DRAFT_285180 [Daldinia loculata]KAI1650285.1 hypothetical protein F4817DRAFT_285180 [Daldinia loculata]KAI2779793.1 hypothetical protein F4815DRAFT_172121 [Daldinia loculata]
MDQDDSGSGNIFATYPFSWVLVPIIIFVGVGTLLMCYRYRRRRKLRMLYGTSALERDLEAMGNRSRSRAPAERRTRGGRRGLGPDLGSREEGLNELGEAPPAYTPAQKRPDNTDDIELSPLQPSPGAVDTDGPGTSRPPTYEELQQGADLTQSTTPVATSNIPEPPPRAVLPPH